MRRHDQSYFIRIRFRGGLLVEISDFEAQFREGVANQVSDFLHEEIPTRGNADMHPVQGKLLQRGHGSVAKNRSRRIA